MIGLRGRSSKAWVAIVVLIASAIQMMSACTVLAASIEVVKLSDELDLITITGPLEYRDDVVFRIKAIDSRKAIVGLNSPGGNLDAGLSIGKQIRENGYSTLVGRKLCASACALGG
jgi:hypothetical protein